MASLARYYRSGGEALIKARVVRLRRPIAAFVTGGSVAGFLAVHAVHAAAMTSGPMVVQFVCSIVR